MSVLTISKSIFAGYSVDNGNVRWAMQLPTKQMQKQYKSEGTKASLIDE